MIWNDHVSRGARVSFKIALQFEALDRVLFEILVLAPLEINDDYATSLKTGFPSILVRPRGDRDQLVVTLLGARGVDGNVYYAEESLVWNEAFEQVRFMDFFDWDFYGVREMTIIRATVTRRGGNKTDDAIILVDEKFVDFELVDH